MLGNTPLHYLAATNEYEAIEWLVSHGAELNIYNHSGKLPCELSKIPEIIKILVPKSV